MAEDITAAMDMPATAAPQTPSPNRDNCGTPHKALPELADALLDLSRLALRLGKVDRTAVYHPDQVTPESDTDHTVMTGWVACALAARLYPQLNIGLIAQFSLVHDAPEAYAGDTPTLRITAAGKAAKAEREHAAFLRLAGEFAGSLPWFVETMAVYEAQQLPEARFVRAVDKVLPKLVHLLDGATGLLEQGHTRAELAKTWAQQRVEMTPYTAEFPDLLRLHAELATRVLAQPALAKSTHLGCGQPSGLG